MLGWFLVGAALDHNATVAYWDRIKRWANAVVEDKLERELGYGAGRRLHHAVSIADRVGDNIRNRMIFYVKKETGVGYDTMEETLMEDFRVVEAVIVQKIDEQGAITQEFQYRA